MDYKSVEFERVCAFIDLAALKGNVTAIKRRLTPGTRLMAVVKANAYGHGAVRAAQAAINGGADMLGVATSAEGIELRNAGIDSDILVFGTPHTFNFSDMLNFNLTAAVYTYEGARLFSETAQRLGKKAEVHIKVDTGMNRVGMPPDDERGLTGIYRFPGLRVTGVYSHLADSSNTDMSFTHTQRERFLETIGMLASHGIEVPSKHLSNSCAIIGDRSCDLDMVRAGTAIYGLMTAEDTGGDDWGFKPVMTLAARVVQVKSVRANETVGYNRTYRAPTPRRIATLAVGYADGFPREQSNRGAAVICGVKAPVVGIVCMDQIMIDVTHAGDVREGDYAYLLGGETAAGSAAITAKEAAAAQGTISLTITTCVSARVPRYYVM